MDFVDSNVWLYALIRGTDLAKHRIATALVAKASYVVSTQVINGVCVNLKRKAVLADSKIERLVRAFYRRSVVMPVDKDTMLRACRLRGSYSLSFWDSLIVASALAAGCNCLYSEDLCDGQIIEGTLTITNPFC